MFKTRVAKIQAALSEGQALYVISGPHRFYLTGFHSSAGMVLITKKNAYFFIDCRYCEKASSVVESCKVLLYQGKMSELTDTLKADGVKELLIETYAVSLSEYKALCEAFPEVDVSKSDKMDILLEEMRAIKTKEELSLICAAQQMTDETFSYILNRIEVGRTEKEIMLDMEFYMRKLGSEGVSFDFIVVSGKNSSLPHGVPTDKKIERGDFITMDFGAVVGGYHSDMTRTVAVGQVSEEQKKVYDTVLQAQLAAIDAIRPGVVCTEIDKVARDLIYGAGYEGCFGHGLGHSLGIEIHENPNFNMRWTGKTAPGQVMTVEPGIYLENRFGVRIEDMVYITGDGCENLTKSKKELIIL